MYHLQGSVIFATVGFVYINLQPEYEFPSSTRFAQFRKFGELGAPSSAVTPKENLSVRGPSFSSCLPVHQI